MNSARPLSYSLRCSEFDVQSSVFSVRCSRSFSHTNEFPTPTFRRRHNPIVADPVTQHDRGRIVFVCTQGCIEQGLRLVPIAHPVQTQRFFVALFLESLHAVFVVSREDQKHRERPEGNGHCHTSHQSPSLHQYLPFVIDPRNGVNGFPALVYEEYRRAAVCRKPQSRHRISCP